MNFLLFTSEDTAQKDTPSRSFLDIKCLFYKPFRNAIFDDAIKIIKRTKNRFKIGYPLFVCSKRKMKDNNCFRLLANENCAYFILLFANIKWNWMSHMYSTHTYRKYTFFSETYKKIISALHVINRAFLF